MFVLIGVSVIGSWHQLSQNLLCCQIKNVLVSHGGGYSTDVWVGRCGPGAETMTLFKTQLILWFHYPVQDRMRNFQTLSKTFNSKSIASIRRPWVWITFTSFMCFALQKPTKHIPKLILFNPLGHDRNWWNRYPVQDKTPWKPYPIGLHVPGKVSQGSTPPHGVQSRLNPAIPTGIFFPQSSDLDGFYRQIPIPVIFS